jgi:amino acid transporter
MLSSDKNVESIAQLVEVLKQYLDLQKEFLKLNVIEKVVKLVTALTVAIIFILLAVAVLFYLSFALAYWMAPLTGLSMAFFLIALCYLALFLVVFLNRKAWIERPLVRFLANTLMN